MQAYVNSMQYLYIEDVGLIYGRFDPKRCIYILNTETFINLRKLQAFSGRYTPTQIHQCIQPSNSFNWKLTVNCPEIITSTISHVQTIFVLQKLCIVRVYGPWKSNHSFHVVMNKNLFIATFNLTVSLIMTICLIARNAKAGSSTLKLKQCPQNCVLLDVSCLA